MGVPQGRDLVRKKSWSFCLRRTAKVIIKTVVMILCFLIYLVIIPIFFAAMFPFYIYRFIVILAQKLFKPNWVGIMSTRDAIVGLDNIKSRCECMITVLLILKGEADTNHVRKVFQREVMEAKNSKGELSYQKLKHYFESWMGFTFWKKEEEFKLESHVREYACSEFDDLNNNSDVMTEEQLMKGLGQCSTRPFPPGKSPWEVLVVRKFVRREPQLHHGVKPTEPVKDTEVDVESAVVLRIHHAIGDGYSIMKLIMSNLCGDPLSLVPRAPIRKVSPVATFIQYIGIMCLTPFYHFRQFFFNVDRTVWHLPSTKLEKNWNFTMTERMSFTDIKETSNRFGVCVTATLIAGLAGGINNFLKKKGHEKRNKNVMRGLSPMPWKNHPMDTLVNHWTVGIFDIPVQESCPRKRILAAHKSADNLKKSPILLTNFITVPVLLGAPNYLTDFWGTNWMTTMILSNFPGPNSRSHAFYKTNYIDDVISWVPHMRGSAGLGIMFLSYNGGVRISISVDKTIMKTQQELDELCHLIEKEFISLRSLQPALETTV